MREAKCLAARRRSARARRRPPSPAHHARMHGPIDPRTASHKTSPTPPRPATSPTPPHPRHRRLWDWFLEDGFPFGICSIMFFAILIIWVVFGGAIFNDDGRWPPHRTYTDLPSHLRPKPVLPVLTPTCDLAPEPPQLASARVGTRVLPKTTHRAGAFQVSRCEYWRWNEAGR